MKPQVSARGIKFRMVEHRVRTQVFLPDIPRARVEPNHESCHFEAQKQILFTKNHENCHFEAQTDEEFCMGLEKLAGIEM